MLTKNQIKNLKLLQQKKCRDSERLFIIEGFKLVNEAINIVGATSPKDMGKVIGILKPRIQGRADMGKVSSKIKEKLSAH